MTDQPKRPQAQDVVGIVRMVCQQRARQRRIPLNRRIITVKKVKGDYHINRFEIFIDWTYATTGNPVTMIDRVLDAVVTFDQREHEERVRKINIVKSEVMKWAAYLQRTLSPRDYERFVHSLLPRLPGDGPVIPIELLAPDPLNLDLNALIAEGEGFQYKGIYLSV